MKVILLAELYYVIVALLEELHGLFQFNVNIVFLLKNICIKKQVINVPSTWCRET